MSGAVNHVQFLAARVISFCKPIEKVCNNRWLYVSYEKVVDMPANSHLLAMYDFVGNAWVVRINLESKRKEVSNKLAIEQQSTFHHAVDCLFQLDVKDCFSFSICSNKLLVKRWSNFNQEFHKNAIEAQGTSIHNQGYRPARMRRGYHMWQCLGAHGQK